VAAGVSSTCPTYDAALAPVCESYCDFLGCPENPSDEACLALADAFQQRTGDPLSCGVTP
jgi:hypothetical protein